MTDEELITFVGKSVINNWEYILGIYFTLLSGGVALSWMISNLIHKREIKVLQLEITHQKERFSQFESIMEQRIASIQSEAEMLQRKINFVSPAVPAATPLSDPFAGIEQSISPNVDCLESVQGQDVEYLDIPAPLKRSAPLKAREKCLEKGGVSDDKMLSLLDKTDAVNRTLREIEVPS